MLNVKKILLLLLLFFLPTQLGMFFFIPDSIVHGIPIDLLAPALYVTDILVLASVILNLFQDPGTIKKMLKRVQHDKIIVIAFLFIIGNVFFALSPIMGIYKLIKLMEMGTVFWIMKKSKIEINHVLIALLAMAALQLALGLAHVIAGNSIQGIFYLLGERSFSLSTPGIAKVSMQGLEILRAYATFPHPNALGGFYLLLYSFILFSPTLSSPRVLGEIQKNLFLIISTLLIIFSFSKVALMGYVLLTVVNVLRKTSTCTWCKLSGLVLPIALSGVFFMAQGDPETIDKRIWLATSSFMIIREHLLTGVGLGNYLIAQGTFPIPYSYHFLQPVHNIFLLLIAELGVPLCALMTYIFVKIVRPLWESPVFNAMLFVIIFTGMFDHYWLTIQQNMLLVPVVFGLLTNNTKTI